MAKKKKDLSHYRALPYTKSVRLEVDEDGSEYFVASVAEIQGLEADGDTAVVALHDLMIAFDEYVALMQEKGWDIPEPVLWPGPDYVAPPVRRSRKALVEVDWNDLDVAMGAETKREVEYA
jgi:predicted RNase H-like HicB family nuclease